MKNIHLINDNIYITSSDEEIKPNVYCLINGVLCKTELLNNKIVSRQLVGGATMDICKSEYSEIILTTDPKLIKDGIQPIDDEFLQWFVQNPSCEEVEVESWETKGEWDLDYKIIIPQNEAKQRAKNYMSLKGALEPKQIKCYCGHTTMCDCSPLYENKQQTLEESLEKAAHKMLMDFGIMSVGESINVLNVKKLMVLFAKEQQARMYSEEDMRLAFETGRNFQLTGEDNFNELIEQFKKK